MRPPPSGQVIPPRQFPAAESEAHVDFPDHLYQLGGCPQMWRATLPMWRQHSGAYIRLDRPERRLVLR